MAEKCYVLHFQKQDRLQYRITADCVAQTRANKGYIENYVFKRTGKIPAVNLDLFYACFSEGRKSLVYTRLGAMYYVTKYTTFGIMRVHPGYKHRISIQCRVPLFLFKGKHGANLDKYLQCCLPRSKDFVARNFHVERVDDEEVIPEGTVYFMYAPCHCMFKNFIQNDNREQYFDVASTIALEETHSTIAQEAANVLLNLSTDNVDWTQMPNLTWSHVSPPRRWFRLRRRPLLRTRALLWRNDLCTLRPHLRSSNDLCTLRQHLRSSKAWRSQRLPCCRTKA